MKEPAPITDPVKLILARKLAATREPGAKATLGERDAYITLLNIVKGGGAAQKWADAHPFK